MTILSSRMQFVTGNNPSLLSFIWCEFLVNLGRAHLKLVLYLGLTRILCGVSLPWLYLVERDRSWVSISYLFIHLNGEFADRIHHSNWNIRPPCPSALSMGGSHPILELIIRRGEHNAILSLSLYTPNLNALTCYIMLREKPWA